MQKKCQKLILVDGRFFGRDFPGELVESVFMVVTIRGTQMAQLGFGKGVFGRCLVEIIEEMNNEPPFKASVFRFLEIDKKGDLLLVGNR